VVHRIRDECEKYGLCTIVPPEEWRPPFAIDIDASAASTMRFDTKEQRIDTIQVALEKAWGKRFTGSA
jgi:histone demethylase JARID1